MVRELTRRIVLEVPPEVEYNYELIKRQPTLGATLKEVFRQAGENIGRHLSLDCIADIISYHASGGVFESLDTVTLGGWLSEGRSHRRGLSVKGAKVVAAAFRLPEDYLTRFYEASSI